MTTPTTKQCSRCKQTKSIVRFHFNGAAKRGGESHKSTCDDCERARIIARKMAAKAKAAAIGNNTPKE